MIIGSRLQGMVRVLFGGLVFVTWGLSAHAAADVPQVELASAGKLAVGSEEIRNLIAALPSDQREALLRTPETLEQLVRGRLAEKMLLNEATNKKWAQRPEVVQQISATTNEVVERSYLASVSQVSPDYPSEQDLRAAYDKNKEALVVPASYRVGQIFIVAPLNGTDDLAGARKKAAEASVKAHNAGADFVKLATEYSGSKDKLPEDTGWVSLNQLLPEVRTVVAQMRTGDISQPVQSMAGFHVLKLLDMRPQRDLSFDEVKDRMRIRLRQERQEQLARDYLAGLANSSTVKLDQQALKGVVETLKARN